MESVSSLILFMFVMFVRK